MNTPGFITGPPRMPRGPYECFATVKVPAGSFFGVRADGHNFHALTSKLAKPFDDEFRSWMEDTVQDYLMVGHCVPFFAFSFSDEVTLLFRKDNEQYARRIEKLDSLIASALSSLFTKRIGTVAFFDARVLILPKFGDMIRYLVERQSEVRRDCVNGYTFYTLVRNGLSPEQAGERMRGWNFRRMTRYLLTQQIAFGKLPPWQKRGVAFYWETYRKPGFNPLTVEQTVAIRFKLRKNERLPRFDSKAGRRLVRKALEARNCVGSWL